MNPKDQILKVEQAAYVLATAKTHALIKLYQAEKITLEEFVSQSNSVKGSLEAAVEYLELTKRAVARLSK